MLHADFRKLLDPGRRETLVNRADLRPAHGRMEAHQDFAGHEFSGQVSLFLRRASQSLRRRRQPCPGDEGHSRSGSQDAA